MQSLENDDLRDPRVRRLYRKYTGVWGVKVFWTAAFTLLPLLVRTKVDYFALRVSPATLVYAAYHALGIYTFLIVVRLRGPRELYAPDEREREIAKANAFGIAVDIVSAIAAALFALTILAKLTIDYGTQSYVLPLPEHVYKVLGVPVPEPQEEETAGATNPKVEVPAKPVTPPTTPPTSSAGANGGGGIGTGGGPPIDDPAPGYRSDTDPFASGSSEKKDVVPPRVPPGAFPPSGWYVLAGSESTRAGAQATADRLNSEGFSCRVLFSSTLEGVTPGRFVVVAGTFGSRSEAEFVVETVQAHGIPDAYTNYLSPTGVSEEDAP